MLLMSLRTRVVLVLAGAFAAVLAGGMAFVWASQTLAGGDAPTWLLPLAALGGLAALLFVADYVVRRWVLAPLERMTATAREIADGDHERRVQEAGPRELRELGGSINRMADRLLADRRTLAENVESLREVNRMHAAARDELIQAEKLASVGRMASGLAHELGNPLQSIMSYLDVGRRRGSDDEWVDGVEEEARRIDEIVRGLLDFARPGEPAVERHEPEEIIRGSLNLLESQGALDQVDVEIEMDDALPDVWVSRVRLQQVMVNLLLNAVDALSERDGRRLISVRTRTGRYEGPPGFWEQARRSDDPEGVDYSHLRELESGASPLAGHRLERGEEVVVVEVRDTGPGLSVDPPEKVFEPFFTTKDPGRGTGLGLAVSARLVQQMGGTMEVDGHAEDGGACFRVLLPTRRRANPSAGSTENGGRRE